MSDCERVYRCAVLLAGVDLGEVNSGIELSESLAGRSAGKGGGKNGNGFRAREDREVQMIIRICRGWRWDFVESALGMLKSGYRGKKQRVEEQLESRGLEFIYQIFSTMAQKKKKKNHASFTGTSQVGSQIMHDPKSSEVNRKSGILDLDAHCIMPG